MRFSLWFDDICSQPAQRVLELVRQADKAALGELRIYDLLRDGERPLLWGVYLFFSPAGECLYVGKNSAQKFVERIPAHLSLAETGWMNHLVRRIRRCEGLSCLADAADAARGHGLLLIPVSRKEQRRQLAGLEKFFQLYAAPKYNALDPERKRYRGVDLAAPLTDVLECM